MCSRVYIGKLRSSVKEKDVRKFFNDYGVIDEVIIKNGYGFVDFKNAKRAELACKEMNGQTICGQRIIILYERGRTYESLEEDPYPDFQTLTVAKILTKHRVEIEELASSVTREVLREALSKVSKVTFVDVYRNDGIAAFASLKDMKNAIEKLDKTRLHGQKMRIYRDEESCANCNISGQGSKRPCLFCRHYRDDLNFDDTDEEVVFLDDE